MHEYGIVQALLERVAGEAKDRGAVAVHRVEVRLGELAGVEPELLATAFEFYRQATVCAAAELLIRAVPARWECPSCAAEIDRSGFKRCARCGRPARLAAGDEIVLDRIEMEVA
jgi:hydrogenase nickel incorporation protein HypA/HybF